MSLQIRLAAFYTALVGLVLVAFGWAVYARSTEILISQIDDRLDSAIKEADIVLDNQDNHEILIAYDSSVLIQLFDNNGELINTTEATMEQLSGNVIVSDVMSTADPEVNETAVLQFNAWL